MTQYDCILLDEKRCINCKACEIHCATWHDLPVPLARHSGGDPVFEGENIVLPLQFFACMHCKNPLCLKACKHEAMYCTEDGMVHIDAERCTGCGDCRAACPTHMPLLNPHSGKFVKCDLCAERCTKGEAPACVAGCISGALHLASDAESHKRLFKEQIVFLKKHPL
ncbi:MAG: 4Fe-4S binding protein [Desulfovibrionaceae bacterium]|nr:4Fe-4S binding protein [Desulfovibrionaceae bacterium]